MNLTLVIPTHNDQRDLCRLLQCAARLDLMTHVVVVDDGSDQPVTTDRLVETCGLGPAQLTLLRNDTALGPGMARNRALEHVTTDHLLFLDSDDLPTSDLVHLLRDLEGRVFDFCIFQYHDTRMEREQSWGQMPWDQTHWRAAGVEVGALAPVNSGAAAQLSRTGNYPWNKIYRTGFLRDNAIGCSEILVHEDVELHWRGFLAGSRILASDRVGVVHTVHEHGARLTNRTGAERLAVFDPLRLVAQELVSDKGQNGHFILPFHRFAIGLFDWIWGNLRPDLQPQFAGLVQDFLRDHVPPALLDDMTSADPVLVARVLGRLTAA